MCREAKILLLISALFTFAIGLSNIFVNVFFWKQTNDFKIIVLYNLAQYIVTPVTFMLAGAVAKRKSGVYSLRIGLGVYAVFYILILLLESTGTLYIYLLGIIFGIGTGFYWLAFNTLSFDFTCLTDRDTFNGFNGSCAGIAAAISPIIAAYIISIFEGNKGYNIVFAVTLSLFVLLVFISMLVSCKSYGKTLNLQKVFSSNCPEWSIIRKTTALWGFRDVIIIFVVNILIIETTKSELSLGKLALVGALISSGSYVLVQKIIKPPQRRLAVMLGTIGSLAAVSALILKVDYNMLLLYVILDGFFVPFFLIQLASSTFNVIDREHESDMRIEYLINKDIALNTGRIISAIILLILLYYTDGLSNLKIYLSLIGCMPVAAGYFLRSLRGLDGGYKLVRRSH